MNRRRITIKNKDILKVYETGGRLMLVCDDLGFSQLRKYDYEPRLEVSLLTPSKEIGVPMY